MSSGQYIYRMEADGKLIDSKAMVLENSGWPGLLDASAAGYV